MQPRYVADDLLTLKFAVMQGLGLCALPEYLCDEDPPGPAGAGAAGLDALPPGLFRRLPVAARADSGGAGTAGLSGESGWRGRGGVV